MSQYNFCPKCGAVSKDGVCNSCGYRIPGVALEANPETPENTAPQPENLPEGPLEGGNTYGNYYAYPMQEKKYGTGWILAGIVLVFAILLGTVFAAYRYSKSIIDQIPSSGAQAPAGNEGSTENGSSGNTLPYDFGSGADSDEGSSTDDSLTRYGNYEGTVGAIMEINEESFSTGEWTRLEADPYDGTDPEAYEFDQYIDGTVSYHVEASEWVYSNAAGNYDNEEKNLVLPHDLYMYGSYVRLADTGLANEDAINALIYQRSLQAADLGEVGLYYTSAEAGTVSYAQCTTYVTYMDEDKISLLFDIRSYIVSDYGEDSQKAESFLAGIASLNIDLHTGQELKASELFDFDGDFYQTFKDKCLSQNGSEWNDTDDASLKAGLTDDDRVVWAYTPLGLEVGMNRTAYSGWMTVTFTDYSNLKKVY